MSEPTPEPPVTNPNPQPDNPPEEPAPEPEEPPVIDEPALEPCPSVYPNNPAITCEFTVHSVRMMHRRQTGGPDSPTYEWE
ncbi:hypothetical protein [Streptomyces sp. NPDC058694]|uniref:hypothetical protein n=1 Tax=Streptomyces sp. NPDC058694 TaxID=3346603 RepID=UPI003658F7F5